MIEDIKRNDNYSKDMNKTIPVMNSKEFIKGLSKELKEMRRARIPTYNSKLKNSITYVIYYVRKYILRDKMLNSKWSTIKS